MKRLGLFLLAFFLVMGAMSGVSYATDYEEVPEGYMSESEFCKATEGSVENCVEEYAELRAEGIKIPDRWKPVLKECGLAVLKGIITGVCWAGCVETCGATCVLCIASSGFFVEQEEDCAKAVCKAAGGDDYHWKEHQCQKK